MQDRFKFRAWDVEEERYFNDIEDCRWDDPSGELIQSFEDCLWEPDFIIEQCTGLKDRNGKLIFEGDIVETHDYTTEYSQILFDKGCYVLKSKDAAMYEHLSSYEEECEVIGNIHENPELLEE